MALSLERIVDLIDACEIDAAPMLETGSNIAGGSGASVADPAERSAQEAALDIDPTDSNQEQ
jgi:hypothetical protein